MIALRDALAKYIAVRRALGTQLRDAAVTLSHFVEFLEGEGAEFVTTQLALRWARKPEHAQPTTWAARLSLVRQFAAWLSVIDPRTEVPPRRIIGARRRRNTPHIFSEQEITRLMDEAGRLPSPTGLRALTYVTLIGSAAGRGVGPRYARRRSPSGCSDDLPDKVREVSLCPSRGLDSYSPRTLCRTARQAVSAPSDKRISHLRAWNSASGGYRPPDIRKDLLQHRSAGTNGSPPGRTRAQTAGLSALVRHQEAR
jgi:hypothetical protein